MLLKLAQLLSIFDKCLFGQASPNKRAGGYPSYFVPTIKFECVSWAIYKVRGLFKASTFIATVTLPLHPFL